MLLGRCFVIVPTLFVHSSLHFNLRCRIDFYFYIHTRVLLIFFFSLSCDRCGAGLLANRLSSYIGDGGFTLDRSPT